MEIPKEVPFVFLQLWETVLNNVIQQVFSPSSIWFKSTNITTWVKKNIHLEIRTMSRLRRRQQKGLVLI